MANSENERGRPSVAETLTEHIENVLDSSRIGVNDNFCDTGPAKAVVPLRSKGWKRPLFLFHDGSGHVRDYVQLATKLGSARAIYGLQRGEAEIAGDRPTCLQDLAALYVKEIRRLQPHGPYVLGGQRHGGLLAFEAAQQLRGSGEPVDLVVLIDTAFPCDRLERMRRRFSRARYRRRSVSLERSRRRSRLPEVADYYDSLASGYRPQSYEAAMALICVGPLHNQWGWVSVSRKGLEVVELPAQEIGAPPTAPAHVNDLAQTLDRILAKLPR